MYSLDRNLFLNRLRERGYGNIGELAESLGVHRNTISYYLSGRGIFPQGLQKVLRALDLAPAQIIVEQKEKESSPSIEKAYGTLDQLHQEYPQYTFVLFGSRAKEKAHRYSDWDIGVFSRDGLPNAQFLKVFHHAEDLGDGLPYFLNVVNLNTAPIHFLKRISRDWKFLNGSQLDWFELQRRSQKHGRA